MSQIPDSRLFIFYGCVCICRVRVREPMDLGTIAERVRSLNYYGADIDLFDRDVSLVWSNCYTYNLEGSGIYENAKV